MEQEHVELMREFADELESGRASAEIADYVYPYEREFLVSYGGDLAAGAYSAGTRLLSHTDLSTWIGSVDDGDFEVLTEIDDDAWPLFISILEHVDGLRVDIEEVRSARD